MFDEVLKNLKKIHHATFRIVLDGKVIYTDPYKIKDEPHDADIILISHDHFDHCSVEDIDKVRKDDTKIVANISCIPLLKKHKAIFLKPWESETVDGISIKSVPAYNVNENRLKYHPKDKNYSGFIFGTDDVKIYFAGDTDFIPEMEKYECNIALIPVSGTYVMTYDEAVKAAEAIKPDIAIPMHYGLIVGDSNDALNFKKYYSGKTVIL